MLTRGELIDLLQRTSWSDDAGRTKQADFILESFEVAPAGTFSALAAEVASLQAAQATRGAPKK